MRRRMRRTTAAAAAFTGKGILDAMADSSLLCNRARSGKG
jgi:hypothetical protein